MEPLAKLMATKDKHYTYY